MEKMQAAMANPALAMQDPDVMKIIMKLQGLTGGGMGGGMGGMGGYPAASAPASGSGGAPSGPKANIPYLTTSEQLAKLLADAGSKLAVVNYTATWCGPCKNIAPLFQELATRYAGKVVFAKVDGDQARDLVLAQGVSGFPTFQFYVSGQKIEAFSGADQTKLRQIVQQYGEFLPPPPPCPYKHFPLKEAELVKYADMKWELVTPKFRELSSKFASEGEASANKVLPEAELKALEGLCATVANKAAFHTSSLSAAQFDAINKLLTLWPQTALAPLVNTIRMAVFHPDLAQKYAAESNNKGANGQQRRSTSSGSTA